MLQYDEYGNRDNTTILLLHGAGALDTFCRQYCFSDKYHLVVPHLAGAGKTADEIYDPEKTVEELFVLINALQKKRIGVVGHSLGGQIAIMLVSRRPELFCRFLKCMGKSQTQNDSQLLFSCRISCPNASLQISGETSGEILALHGTTNRYYVRVLKIDYTANISFLFCEHIRFVKDT